LACREESPVVEGSATEDFDGMQAHKVPCGITALTKAEVDKNVSKKDGK